MRNNQIDNSYIVGQRRHLATWNLVTPMLEQQSRLSGSGSATVKFTKICDIVSVKFVLLSTDKLFQTHSRQCK